MVFRHSLNILLYVAFSTVQISLLFFWGHCVIVVLFKMIFSTPYIVCFHSAFSLCQSCLLDFLNYQVIPGSVTIIELRTWKSTRISVRSGRALHRNISISLIWLGPWLKISANHYLINFLNRKCHCPSWVRMRMSYPPKRSWAHRSWAFSIFSVQISTQIFAFIMHYEHELCLLPPTGCHENSPETKPPAWMHQTRKF